VLYFEDILVGYRSHVGDYEISKEEIIEVARRWDPQPFHIDEEQAEQSVFGGLVASSVHLFAICTRLFFDHKDKIAVMAMLSKDSVELPNPVRPGEILRYETECISRRKSASQNDRGIICLSDKLSNPAGKIVLKQTVSLLVASKNMSVDL
tara:strand:- start:59 stop:511 length:453 start_codon:yes stop_codon:yes gene_type:complete